MKKRNEILKKKWIDTELLKIEVPESLHSLIRMKYKVEVYDDSLDAKFNIMGKPTIDNFKTYSSKSKSISKKRKKKFLNDSFQGYGTKAESWVSSLKKEKLGEKRSAIKTQSTSNVKISGIDSRLQTPLKGGKTSKSKRSKQFLDESNSSYHNNSVVKYLSPMKKSSKRSEYGSNYASISQII